MHIRSLLLTSPTARALIHCELNPRILAKKPGCFFSTITSTALLFVL